MKATVGDGEVRNTVESKIDHFCYAAFKGYTFFL